MLLNPPCPPLGKGGERRATVARLRPLLATTRNLLDEPLLKTLRME
ncbi:MAG: hypothetical protein PHD37_05490 [Gallionellaceae bacterium]|nr:hypothetical protein [Gallionellaceae bacterium]